jgi:putative transposase
MCRILGVSRNGYYNYRSSDARKQDPEHEQLLEFVQQIAQESGYSYGSRRMKRALNALGFPLSRQKADERG